MVDSLITNGFLTQRVLWRCIVQTGWIEANPLTADGAVLFLAFGPVFHNEGWSLLRVIWQPSNLFCFRCHAGVVPAFLCFFLFNLRVLKKSSLKMALQLDMQHVEMGAVYIKEICKISLLKPMGYRAWVLCDILVSSPEKLIVSSYSWCWFNFSTGLKFSRRIWYDDDFWRVGVRVLFGYSAMTFGLWSDCDKPLCACMCLCV